MNENSQAQKGQGKYPRLIPPQSSGAGHLSTPSHSIYDILCVWCKSSRNVFQVIFLKIIVIYLFGAMLGLCCCVDFSLVAASGATLQLWCAGFSLL